MIRPNSYPAGIRPESVRESIYWPNSWCVGKLGPSAFQRTSNQLHILSRSDSKPKNIFRFQISKIIMFTVLGALHEMAILCNAFVLPQNRLETRYRVDWRCKTHLRTPNFPKKSFLGSSEISGSVEISCGNNLGIFCAYYSHTSFCEILQSYARNWNFFVWMLTKIIVIHIWWDTYNNQNLWELIVFFVKIFHSTKYK